MRSHPLLRGCLTAFVSLCAAPCFASPLITEFLASNNSGLLDEDGTRQDWIEIYNPDAAPVDLGGYHLTDNSGIPDRWTFPSGVILAPGAYLVVFASGKDRAVAGQNLHTDFGLAAGGEYVGLFAPGGAGAALSEYTFLQQSADISYGLLNPVAGSPEGFFTIPTPGAPNNSANSPAPPVVFNPVSKTFNVGTSFNVTLSTSSPGATIRYTTNLGKPIAAQGIMGTFAANAATDELTLNAHGFSDRDEVQLEGASIAGVGQSIVYFVSLTNANTIKLSEEPGGAPVDITASTNITLRRDAALFAGSVGGLCTSSYHRFYDRDPVQITTTGTLPAPLAVGTTYYISITPATPVDRNNYRLAATPGGATINITAAGTGVHTIRLQPSAVYSGPLTVNYTQRIRARSFEAGRPNGPMNSESYLALDTAAQSFTSNIPVMVLHSWGSNHPSTTAPGAGVPEDTKQAVWFVFEPKVEGTSLVTRLTNPPDLVTPGYFERRGSSTFGAAKYSMTMGALNESGTGREVAPLGYASNDDFVLNAPYQFDLSLMHNDLAYRLSNEIGRWAPRTRHVEMFMSVNNDAAASGGNPAYGYVTGSPASADYYGIYSFQDKISRGSGRLDIEKLTPQDNTAPNVQGGYVFKVDRLDAGDSGLAGGGRSFALVQPKEWTSYPSHLQVMTNAQKSYLSTTLNNMYAAVSGPNLLSPTLGYQAHLDVPACIDHWWVSALPKSADAFRLSGYWHKSRNGKLAMGPVFDFDRAMGSADQRDWNPLTWRGDVSDYGTDYFHNAGIYQPNYFHWMFMDPNFWQAVIDRYEDLRRGVLSTAHVHAIVDEYTELLDPGNSFVNTTLSTPAKRNQNKWGGPRNTAQFPGTNGHFRGEAQWLKNWWGKATPAGANGRFDFVDGQFMRPPVSSLADGPVPGGSQVVLSSSSQSISGVKIYYTTDGTDPRAPSTTTQTLYQPGTLTTLDTFMSEIGSVRAIVPDAALNTSIGNTWRNEDFDDSAWFTNAAGTVNGVGYDNSFAGATDYQPFFNVRWNTTTYYGTTPAGISPPGVLPIGASNVMFQGTINGTAYAGNQTCYLRIPFNLTPAQMAQAVSPNKLTLQMRVDDGFVAWLNGTELTTARLNAPATASLVWNSAATTTNADGNAIVYANYDITAFMSSLHAGTNVLALHGLNSGLTSSDFLVGAQILLQGNAIAQPAYTPNLTAGATEYTGPLTINGPTQIFARTLHPLLASDPPTATTTPAPTNGGPVPNGSSWSGPSRFYYFPGAVSASQANIKITEVCYHPLPPSPDELTLGYTNSNDFEFIRLTNTGAAPVDLTGIYFSNGLEFTAVPGLQNWLPAGASVVVVENSAAFTYRYGTTFTVLGEFNGELDDGGEHIVLNDRTGAVISDFIYGDEAPWPAAADAGFSLVYVSGDQTLPESWRASLDPGGSAVTSFARWQRRYFSAPELPAQNLTADTDLDGLNNLGEYAFATDPRVPGSREAATGTSVPGNPPGLAVRRRTGAPDLTWTFEVSSSLTGGAWVVPGAPPVSTVNNGDGTETVTWQAPAAPPGTRLFLRAVVTSP